MQFTNLHDTDVAPYGAMSTSGSVAPNYYDIALGFCTGADTISDSWEQISASISDGTYKTKYAIGDTKAVDMGDLGVICMQIAAFDADRDENGDTVPITWIAQQMLETDHRMNASGTSGGYPASELKTYVNSLKSRLPSVLQSMIVPVEKTSRQKDPSDTDLTTIEELWIPSNREVYGGTSYERSGPVYSSLFIDTASRKKQAYGSSSTRAWWLRSVNSDSSFRSVFSDGDSGGYSPVSDRGVVLGFCTGARPPQALTKTWDQVDADIRDGSYKTKYLVGDTVALDLGSDYNGGMQIAAIDTDVDESGNAVPITWISESVLSDNHPVTGNADKDGGWPESDMKTYMGELKTRLPETVRNMIVPVQKATAVASPSPVEHQSLEEVWVPSYREVFGGTSYEKSGPVYSELFPNATSRIKARYGTKVDWWLRTETTSHKFGIIDQGGGDGSSWGNQYYGYQYVFAFCTGASSST